MITFPCKYVDSNGKKCPGQVSYKVAPVEMVALVADFNLNKELLPEDLPEIKMTKKFEDAVKAHISRREKTEPKATKIHTRYKTIYLTCDGEGMHVEPYDIPSK
jgi:hypothetical protein